MPSLTLTTTQAQVDRLLAALPPDYEATAAGAKQFLIDCFKERVRAKEYADNAAQVSVEEPAEVVVT